MNDTELQRAVAEYAPTAGTVQGGKSAYAQFVVETIQPNHLSLELFKSFLPTKQYKVGDMPMKRVRKGRYPVRTMVPGSKHLHDQVWNQEKYTFMFDRLIVGTSANVWEIRSGEIGTTESMMADMKADLFDELVSRVFSLLGTAWNGTDTPNNYLDASSGGLTATGLDTLIENMIEVNGQVSGIFGTRKALMPVYKFAQYREFVLSGTGTDRLGAVTPAFLEYVTTHKVSTYNGIPLIEVPQVFAQRSPSQRTRLVDNNKLVLLSQDAGEIALMGDFETQDYTDPTTQPANYVMHGWQAWGMLLDNLEGISVIKTS